MKKKIFTLLLIFVMAMPAAKPVNHDPLYDNATWLKMVKYGHTLCGLAAFAGILGLSAAKIIHWYRNIKHKKVNYKDILKQILSKDYKNGVKRFWREDKATIIMGSAQAGLWCIVLLLGIRAMVVNQKLEGKKVHGGESMTRVIDTIMDKREEELKTPDMETPGVETPVTSSFIELHVKAAVNDDQTFKDD